MCTTSAPSSGRSLRLRRCKVVIINSAFRSALQDLLMQLLKQPGQYSYDVEDEAQALAHAWFTDKEARKQVLETLSRFELDELAIEAEAIRKSSADLELLDRMLSSLESRRDKALGCVAEYRASLAHQLRQSADGIIDGKGVLRLEDASSKSANGGLTMASERQIAANRRNARKSTGPRSGAGRKRASRNAYRHGLTLSISSTAAYAKQLDKLVRKIAGDTEDEIVLERARAVAQAELELARVRRAKVALIERASAFGELDPPQLTVAQMIRVA